MFLACVLWARSALALDPALDASQYGHTAWRIGEGFMQSRITALAQGPDGYLWLGTESGLLRFDGVRALPWTPPRGSRLPHDHVRVLAAARDGRLWIGTLTGLVVWDGRTLVTHPRFKDHIVNALREDREGTLWAAGKSVSNSPGVLLCAIRAETTECHGGDGSLGEVGVVVYEQSNGVLWLAGPDRVWRWKNAPRKSYAVPDPTGSLQPLAESESGTILIGTRQGLREIAEHGVQSHPLPGLGQDFRASVVLRDRDGALWIGTREAGLIHFHGRRTDTFGSAQGLSADRVTGLFEDREGNIWVTTGDGLDRFRPQAAATYGKAHGVDVVGAALQVRGGSIWVSTAAGIKRWEHGRFTDVEVRGLPKAAASLFEDSRGRIWVGSPSGLGFVEQDTYRSIHRESSGSIDSFAEDNEGNVWVAHRERGVLRISADGRVDTAWEKKSLFPRRLAADPLRGGIWIASFQEGLVHFVDGRVAASYSLPDEHGGGLISQLRVTADGTVWATSNRGLVRFKDGRIATLGRPNGLPCDQITWMIEDAEHAWWLYTGCGLVRLAQAELDAWSADADTGKASRRVVATVLGSSDGVRSGGVGSSSPHAARSGDGKLWFAGDFLLTVIDPRRLNVNKQPPPVHVESISADRRVYELLSSRVRLPPLVRDLEIQYTATSLVAPEKTQFKYMLEGRDTGWNDAGNRRQAFYTDLDPGDYRFRVIASNNSGIWNEDGASLEFSVAPAYWQTWWFRALCVAAFAALLWALYRLRVRQLARQFNMTLDARVKERTRIARELHDTLLQSFHGLLLRFQTALDLLPNRASEARQVLASAIDQAAEAITEGRDAVQGLRASVTETNDLADAIRTLGEQLAANSGARKVVLRVEVQGASRTLHPIMRDEIFRIAGEAMRNAFQHAEAKRIEVELYYDAQRLRLRVRDDGKGIDPKVLNQGGREGHFGMPGMRERAKLIGGKLAVWSARSSGTEIELTIPASRAYAASGSRFDEKIFDQSTASE